MPYFERDKGPSEFCDEWAGHLDSQTPVAPDISPLRNASCAANPEVET